MTMQWQSLAVAAALALLVACDRAPEPRAGSTAPPASASGGATTPSTPANIGQPGSQDEKKEGANPVQGQVDPKQSDQHKDFQQSGDGKGPTSEDTQPKPGG
jgi:hypothetical protein